MVRIRIKIASTEVEVEAEPENIEKAISLLPSVLEKITLQKEIHSQEVQQKEIGELPVLQINKEDSLSDIILKMFSQPWGSKERKLSEVREVLRNYGLNFPKQSVAVSLLRLAKSGKIRRFKSEDGEYAYTSITPSTELILAQQNLSAD